jgi:hypothetical protein
MSEQLLDSVRSKYGAVAVSTLSNNHAGVQAVAEAFGYTAEELTSIPADANMGLSWVIPQPPLISDLARWSLILALVEA